MKRYYPLALFLVLLLAVTPVLAAQQPEVKATVKNIIEVDGLQFKDLNDNGKLDVYEDWRADIDDRVEGLLDQMTIEEKIGQMFHSSMAVPVDGVVGDRQTEQISEKHITSYLNNGSTGPAAFAAWSNGIQEFAEGQRLGIPVLFSSDPRNSGDMSRDYFTVFADGLGHGAARDPEIVEEFGRIVAEEYRAVGLHMPLGPQADIATDLRWWRTVQTFGEDPELVTELTAALVRGYQGKALDSNKVLTMTKHFPGAGAIKNGQNEHMIGAYPGNNFDTHLEPFAAAFAAGSPATMIYYSLPTGIDTIGSSMSKAIVTDALRTKLGFDGVACSDWGAVGGDMGDIGALETFGHTPATVKEKYLLAIEAGLDQFGGEGHTEVLLELIEEGSISVERIDQSVRRILRLPFMLGLFENPYVNTSRAPQVVGSKEHQDASYRGQLASIVLLTNDGILPAVSTRLDVKPDSISSRKTRVFVVGMDPDVAKQYADVVEDPEKADLAVISTTVTPRGGGFRWGDWSLFAEGDIDLTILPEKLALIEAVTQTGVPTVVVFELDKAAVLPAELFDTVQATLVRWLGVTDNAIFDVLFGRHNPTGKMPFQMPSTMESVRNQFEDVPFDLENPRFDYGHGLSY